MPFFMQIMFVIKLYEKIIRLAITYLNDTCKGYDCKGYINFKIWINISYIGIQVIQEKMAAIIKHRVAMAWFESHNPTYIAKYTLPLAFEPLFLPDVYHVGDD